MSDPIATTLVRVRAITGTPDFLAVESAQTGRVPGSTYKPTFVGEFGWMLHADAEPLDLGVATTGDQLAICWNWSPQQMAAAVDLAPMPVVTGFAISGHGNAPTNPPPDSPPGQN